MKIHYLNLAPYERHANHANDRAAVKDMMTLHETVSHDVAGLVDIVSVVKGLVAEKYGIHGMSDGEGHCGWAYGYATSEFIHAGGVNERSCGIEQVSWIPYLVQSGALTHDQAYKQWCHRERQLEATAMLVAGWHVADPEHRPLVFSDGLHPGVTSHWNVSQHFAASEGHFDCWPHHLGGYYPILSVIQKAKIFVAHGYHL